MTAATGHIELDRTVESIQVGRRHRRDLGDLDALAASIERDGLLQPITITPDGLLVCGVRRLAAIRQLGWRTVNVWVRSSISDRLGHLLAEQDDNQLHKTLSPLEAAGLYREIKELMAEDAARRDQATQFSTENQPRWNGGGNFPPPLTPQGKVREQAAAMIPGAPSYKTMDRIGYLQNLATDPATPEPLQTEAQAGLVKIEAGGPVDPVYQRIRDIHQAADDAHLHDLAEQALARVDAQTKEQKGKKKRAKKPQPAAPVVPDARYAVRAFVLTWTELDSWWLHYDLDELAAQLTDEQAEAFYATAEGTRQFATDLHAARQQETATPHLRAL
ncbi:ParB N-terminal domain-containing protein [Propioniciclava soli]|uniref:ParB N-terminal domain-containing protein n=1 Tax=Propioniciclava soli TaxID=2775081 RepID=A0ABZ3C938_9ACTN